MAKGNVLYLDRNDLEKLDVINSVRKRRMCIGIANFILKWLFICCYFYDY